MLTGTNKEYINSRIPHLSNLLVNDPSYLLKECEVIVINTREPEFVDLLSKAYNKTIIDLVRLDESLLLKKNYLGINW